MRNAIIRIILWCQFEPISDIHVSLLLFFFVLSVWYSCVINYINFLRSHFTFCVCVSLSCSFDNREQNKSLYSREAKKVLKGFGTTHSQWGILLCIFMASFSLIECETKSIQIKNTCNELQMAVTFLSASHRVTCLVDVEAFNTSKEMDWLASRNKVKQKLFLIYLSLSRSCITSSGYETLYYTLTIACVTMMIKFSDCIRKTLCRYLCVRVIVCEFERIFP